jgi:glycosyltransferase involved in cell wall biosynthesis
LPVFVDLERYRTLLHRKHPRFFRTILWIGRFEHEKNPLFAFKTLMKAREEGIDACLIMLGEGRLKRSLMQAARRYKKCVEFPGWKDPAPYLAMADVVISTSEHESYGASIVEALAAGVPVVSLDVGVARAAGALVTTLDDLPEVAVSVLQSGKRATLLLPTLDAEAWAKKWRETLL